MLKILSTSQIREADQATISNEPIASIDLMERAATACFEWIKFHFHEQTTFTVIAGVGNNGGDALVVARLLRFAGYDLHTFLVQYSDKLSPDAQINLERLGQSGIEVSIISKSSELPQIGSDDVLIDGIFGSGLSRPAEGVAKSVIDLMNAHSNRIISIDIPSGMYADKPTVSSDSVVHASHTLSLELPKLSFLFPSSEDYVGQMSIIPIGLDHDFIESVESPYNFVDGIDEFKADFERGSFGHKGDYGYCLLLSGSYGMMGAAVLAARSALRAGAGKIRVNVPAKGVDVLQNSVPEAMCSIDLGEDHICSFPSLEEFNAVAVGPGIGTHEQTASVLELLMGEWNKPMIIDADALNIIAHHPELKTIIPANSILTPHVGEFERLFGKRESEFDRLTLLMESAKEIKAYIILKGQYTTIATPKGDVYFNSTGNPGMATAGSGDVLTGLILGLMCQVNDPLISALCGVYIHGLSGDAGSDLMGQHGLIASDLVESIPFAMKTAFNLEE